MIKPHLYLQYVTHAFQGKVNNEQMQPLEINIQFLGTELY